jgi:Pyruvate/2-oxoacid:ferredoxin oxidoreductase delta subunit
MIETATDGCALEQVDSFPLTRRLVEAGSLQRWEEVRDYTQLIAQQMGRLEGAPGPTRREFESPEAASEHVKDLARAAGAGLVGITQPRPYHRARGFEDDSPFVVALAMAMRHEEISQAPDVAAGVEVFRVYYELGETAIRLAEAIRGMGWQATAYHPVSDIGNGSRIFFVPTAIDAGLGELGRAGFLVTPDLGIMVRLAAVTTDLPLAVDAPRRAGINDFCSLCTACLRACPGGAIPAEKTQVGGTSRWQIDSERCFPHFAEHLGCSICMAVCPYALPHVRRNLLERWSARAG